MNSATRKVQARQQFDEAELQALEDAFRALGEALAQVVSAIQRAFADMAEALQQATAPDRMRWAPDKITPTCWADTATGQQCGDTATSPAGLCELHHRLMAGTPRG
jgi:hypothetical protein